jgi:hypothetical protein
MSAQLTIPLRMATMTDEQRLRVAYDKWQESVENYPISARLRLIPFDRAIKNPVTRHGLELQAQALQRREEAG